MIFLYAAMAVAGDLALRTPTEKWVVNFDDAQCVAQRNYGTQDKPFLFAIKRPALGDAIQVAFVRKKSAGDGVDYNAYFSFDNGPPIKTSILMFEPKAKAVQTYSMIVALNDFAPARHAKSLTIRAPGLRERIELADMAKLLGVMDDCVADLKKVWNVSDHPEVRTEPVEGVTGNLSGLLRPDDYPLESLMEMNSGTVTVALLVDEKGRVADCSVIGSSGVAALDGQTCAILRERAKFTAAKGADGKAAKGSFVQRITWRVQ